MVFQGVEELFAWVEVLESMPERVEK